MNNEIQKKFLDFMGEIPEFIPEHKGAIRRLFNKQWREETPGGILYPNVENLFPNQDERAAQMRSELVAAASEFRMMFAKYVAQVEYENEKYDTPVSETVERYQFIQTPEERAHAKRIEEWNAKEKERKKRAEQAELNRQRIKQGPRVTTERIYEKVADQISTGTQTGQNEGDFDFSLDF